MMDDEDHHHHNTAMIMDESFIIHHEAFIHDDKRKGDSAIYPREFGLSTDYLTLLMDSVQDLLGGNKKSDGDPFSNLKNPCTFMYPRVAKIRSIFVEQIACGEVYVMCSRCTGVVALLHGYCAEHYTYLSVRKR